MKKGDFINTPRFLKVRIEEIFGTRKDALKEGFNEPTHYESPEYEIVGKHIGTNIMIFAAYRK